VRASDLYELLNTADSGEALREALAPAMPGYRRGLAEGGRPAPILVEPDEAVLVVARSHLASLCEAFLAAHIDAVELGYVATALERVPDFRFVSEEVEECAFLLSTASERGTTSAEAIKAVLRHLREHAA
jgi:hypothetical protein